MRSLLLCWLRDFCWYAAPDPVHVLAAVVNTTVVAGENLTVGSTVWLPAASVAPGR
jgi:hypothetical protein